MQNISTQALEDLIQLVEEAGRIIMQSPRIATKKADGSDLTPADLRSHTHLTTGISKILGQDVTILSEESPLPSRKNFKGLSVILDPLDGTTNFKNGRRNFAVLVSVLQDKKPIYGIVVLPAYGITVCGGTLTQKAEVRIHDKKQVGQYKSTRALPHPSPSSERIAIVPQRFLDAKEPQEQQIIQGLMATFQKYANNTGFKGSPHILGSIMPLLKKHVKYRIYQAICPNQRPGDWDLAAWDGILRGVGGIMTDTSGAPLKYGSHKNHFKHDGFICWRNEKEAQTYRRAHIKPKSSKKFKR